MKTRKEKLQELELLLNEIFVEDPLRPNLKENIAKQIKHITNLTDGTQHIIWEP